MKKNIFISGTGTDVGKTFIALELISVISSLGLKVGVMKPIETGVKDIPEDANKLFKMAKKYNPALIDLHLEDICPISFALAAAPDVARSGLPIDFDLLQECHDNIAKKCDIMIIEGAGGLLTPVEKKYFMLNLAEMFNARTLLVSSAKLGCINEILLNEKILKFGRQDFQIAINKREEDVDFEKTSLPYLKNHMKDIFVLPDDINLLAKKLIE